MMASVPAETTTDWIIAIGTIVAAVGTVGAVSVALWQAFRQNRAKLRLQAVLRIDESGQHLRLVGTNRGPQPVKLNQARLTFTVSGVPTGEMKPMAGDELPDLFGVGDTATAEWDFAGIDRVRKECNGDPFTHLAFVDALGREHRTPFPGMGLKWQWRRFRREYVPVSTPRWARPRFRRPMKGQAGRRAR